MIAEEKENESGLDQNASAVVRMLRGRPIEPRASTVRARHFEVLSARLQAAREQTPRVRSRRRALAVACGALALGGLGLALRARVDGTGAGAGAGERPLTYTFGGGSPVPGGYIEPAPTATTRTLSFSDGTQVRMAPESRGRVVETTRQGGRIALEDGKAHVNVIHRPGARWVFEAGPFLIHVWGTTFSFGWSGRDARFEVQMESGVVSVTGPVSGGEIVLRAGQKLAIDLRDQTSAPALGPVPPRAEPDRPLSGATSQASRSTGTWAPERWAGRLGEGRADLIVAEARRIGLAVVLESITGAQLATLSSAARYQRDDELARRALLVQRRRFPLSMRAREASFLLGRLDDESRGDVSAALAWYDRYLAEAPDGAYVSEALGRKMVALQRSGRHVHAAEIAADYLRRFPAGTYARAARALVRSP